MASTPKAEDDISPAALSSLLGTLSLEALAPIFAAEELSLKLLKCTILWQAGGAFESFLRG